jgi:hypothetical protein
MGLTYVKKKAREGAGEYHQHEYRQLQVRRPYIAWWYSPVDTRGQAVFWPSQVNFWAVRDRARDPRARFSPLLFP